jgi:hypothetical protein
LATDDLSSEGAQGFAHCSGIKPTDEVATALA